MRRLCILSSVFILLSLSTVAQMPESRWATLDGSKIHYYDTGNAKAKDAIVLIHGWSCNADFWKDTYNAFPTYRVISIDLLGHGKSDAPYVAYSMDTLARSVDTVLNQAKVRKAIVVGHSMGSVVARKFYSLFPAKTLAIVIVDMPIQPMGPEEEMKKFADSVTSNYPQSAEGFVDGMIASIGKREMKAFIRRTMLSTPKHSAVSSLSETFEDANWTATKIDVPLLAITAPSDHWKPSKEDYEKIAPKVEFQLWSGVSHFLHMERPAWFNGQVKGWIIRNSLL
ncbi:MAG: alpha/beta hydrolase [bacterium]|nr:alpha/beta hydrolase [bacterium]